MVRALDAALEAELEADQLFPVLMFHGEFTSGSVYAWTGIGNLVWNGNTYLGVGSFAGISDVEESTEVKASGIKVSLSGVQSDMLALALGECRINKPVRVYLACLNQAGVMQGNPYLIFAGHMDAVAIDDSGDTATITLSVESRLISLEYPKNRRYTHEDQQLDYPGDMFFEYVSAIQNIDLKWGVNA